MSFEFGVIVLEEDLFGVLFFWFFFNLFLSFSGKTVVAKFVNFFQILEGVHFANIVFNDKIGCPFGCVGFVSKDFGVQVSIDFFDFTFTEFLNDLVLFLSKDGKVAVFGFSFEVSQMFFVKAVSCECLFDLFDFAIGCKGQEFGNFLLSEMLVDDIDVEKGRKVFEFQDAFGENNVFTVPNQVEVTLIDDGFLKAFNGVEMVCEGF